MVSSSLLVQWNMRSYRSNGHWQRTSHVLQAQIMCLQETFSQPADVVSLFLGVFIVLIVNILEVAF